MRSFSAIALLSLIGILFFSISGVQSFGGPGGFQTNPFLSNIENERNQMLHAKAEANSIIADPMPGSPLPGPSTSHYFDTASTCSVGELNTLNENTVRPILTDLTATTFFRYFKVSLDSQCPFWVMSRMCKSGGGCHVCRCDDNEVPLPWRIESTDKAVIAPLPNDFQRWDDVDAHMWAGNQVEASNPDSVYVNLVDNPESNTGYSGDEPRRIWDAIYQENCFHVMSTNDVGGMCLEERVFYRLISGLHTSITAHVFARWKRAPDDSWMHNQGLWNMVMGKFPDRLDNLYFTLDFLLRSLRIAQPHLSLIPVHTGNQQHDTHTTQLLSQLANTTKGGELPKLFSSPDQVQLKDDLKNMFRNVSVIMNCVGCEKCRVWGKLNTLGLATALKVTLAAEDERADIVNNLQRNEVVAWINTIASFSESVHYINRFSVIQDNDLKSEDTTKTTLPDTKSAKTPVEESVSSLILRKMPAPYKVFVVLSAVLIVATLIYRTTTTNVQTMMKKHK